MSSEQYHSSRSHPLQGSETLRPSVRSQSIGVHFCCQYLARSSASWPRRPALRGHSNHRKRFALDSRQQNAKLDWGAFPLHPNPPRMAPAPVNSNMRAPRMVTQRFARHDRPATTLRARAPLGNFKCVLKLRRFSANGGRPEPSSGRFLNSAKTMRAQHERYHRFIAVIFL
jgi:hypothetical protein